MTLSSPLVVPMLPSRLVRRCPTIGLRRGAYSDRPKASPRTSGLFQEEMRRIQREIATVQAAIETTEIKLGDFDHTWQQLRQLARLTPRAYQHAPDELRQQLNRFWLGDIAIIPPDVAGHTWSQTAQLELDPDLPDIIEREHKLFERASSDEEWSHLWNELTATSDGRGGSNMIALVPHTGFEPVLPP